MQRSLFVVFIIVIFSMLFLGCEQGIEPISESQSTVETMQMTPSSNLLWPEGKMVDQAVFSIYITGTWGGTTIEVFGLTSDWAENGVNWNWSDFNNIPWSIAGGDIGVKVGEFDVIWNVLGWYEVDITSLVNDWIANGGSNNFGILLKHNSANQEYGRVWYNSSESSDLNLRPKFSLYHDNTSTVIQRGFNDDVFDSWFDSLNPDANFGQDQSLQTRIIFDQSTPPVIVREKRVVVKFPLDIEAQPEKTCETAFAYGNDFANCFILWDEFSNWGWTNGQIQNPGIYTWDIYAGAGQCDLSKGIVVGTLTLDYNGFTASVTYNMDQGYSLKETHLYIGQDPFPSTKKGFTNAPGKFPFKHGDLNDVSSDTYTVSITDNFYIIAHAVVCGQF